MYSDVLLLLLLSWGVNTCLNLLGYAKKVSTVITKYDKPLDNYTILFDGHRLLGDSTTLLGIPVALSAGVLFGITIALPPPFGALAGLCVYTGHAIGSFIKRRLHYSPGQYAPILDHTDSVLTLGMVYYMLAIISAPSILVAGLTSAVLQPLFCYIGYKLHLREKPL
jgi:CDP-archaeol synthase